MYEAAAGRMWEELAESNSYHSQEAAGEKEQLFTKLVSSGHLTFAPFALQSQARVPAEISCSPFAQELA